MEKLCKQIDPAEEKFRREAPDFFGHFGPYFKAKTLRFGAKRQKFFSIFGGDLKKNDPAPKFSNI